jgi:hypothetical protein
MSEGSGTKVKEEALRSTAIACKRLIAVSYDDFQTEHHPISRDPGYFIAIYEIRGL